MITGHYPHQTGVLTNGGKFARDDFSFMGAVFKRQGYETAYFGEWHIPIPTEATDVHGFDTVVGNKARVGSQVCTSETPTIGIARPRARSS